MRGLLRHWWKSSRIPTSKGKSFLRNSWSRSRTVSFEVDRLPTWSTITSGSLEPMILRHDDIQEFDSKWDGILLSMTKIPHDDILEGLYKLRIRESEKLETVLELYDLETHQKKVRTWFTQIADNGEKKVSSRKFEIRILGAEKEILRRTPWSRIRDKAACTKNLLQFPPRYE